MPVWLAIVLALGGSAIITCSVNFFFSRTFYKKAQERDKAQERKVDQDMRDRQELEDRRRADETEELISRIKIIVQPLNDKLDKVDTKLSATSAGTLATLRNDILTCYYRCREKGYRNDYDYQNIHDLYEAYDALDGNSFIKDIMDRFDKLPVKEDVKEIDVHLVTKKKKSTKQLLIEEK